MTRVTSVAGPEVCGSRSTAGNACRRTRIAMPGRIFNSLSLVLVLVATLCISSQVSAGLLGTVNGRTADFTRMPDLSVEGFFNFGDFDDVDYQNLGARVNYRLSPGVILHGDVGLTEIGNFDTLTFGFGAFYALTGLFENIDAAVKGSFHTGDFDDAGDVDVLELEFLFSGTEPIMANGLMWYANIGLHRLDFGVSSDTELGLGGGVVLPVALGEAYAGIDLIDELTFGIGYRYFFQ